jgi:antirestriction protein ArdC
MPPNAKERIMQFDLYAEITKQVMAMLEQGVVPWRSPILGRTSAGHPKNLESGKPYRGVNIFLLAFTAYARGYESSYWVTFNQAKERGGSVRKGEKASMVVFWKQYETEDKDTHQPTKIPVLRYYNVFNAGQCDGLEVPDAPKFEPIDFKPIEVAEAIAKGYEGAPALEHGGSQAYYRPSEDIVKMPEPTRFRTSEEYYSTLFHEYAHSTGHSKRLDRKLDSDPKPFGTPDYGKEELVAEMAAAFLCGQAGITPTVIENQTAYLQGWLKTLNADKKLVIGAAGQAQRAADWIRNERTPLAP